MAHTTFAFLVTCDPAETPESIGEDAVASFEYQYAQSFCEEDNWWTAKVLILKDGCVVPLCSASDISDRDTLQERFAALPVEQRWDEALRDCLLATAYRLRIDGTVNFYIGPEPEPPNQRFEAKTRAMSTGELSAYIQNLAPTTVANTLQPIIAALRTQDPKVTPGAPDSSPLHSISGVWAAREALDAYLSAEETYIFPFAVTPDHPYHNWCCYDLRDNQQDDEQVGILFVDIHT